MAWFLVFMTKMPYYQKSGSNRIQILQERGGNILPKCNLSEKGKDKAALITENASLE